MMPGMILRVALIGVLGLLGPLTVATSAFAQGNAQGNVQGKWERKAPFPDPSEEVLGMAAGGKMYVFAGLAPVWKPKALLYEYDPASDTWTEKKKMALPSHHVAFAEYQGKIYAFGGFVLPLSGPPAWVPIDNSWEYDPATDSWKALAPMPTKRGAAAAAVINGKVYVVGGATTPSNELRDSKLCWKGFVRSSSNSRNPPRLTLSWFRFVAISTTNPRKKISNPTLNSPRSYNRILRSKIINS